MLFPAFEITLILLVVYRCLHGVSSVGGYQAVMGSVAAVAYGVVYIGSSIYLLLKAGGKRLPASSILLAFTTLQHPLYWLWRPLSRSTSRSVPGHCSSSAMHSYGSSHIRGREEGHPAASSLMR